MAGVFLWRSPPLLAEHGIHEGVDHHVALDAQAGQQPLDPLAGLADQDASGDGRVGARILAHDQDGSSPVQPPPVEDQRGTAVMRQVVPLARPLPARLAV